MYKNNFVAVIKCNGRILRERSGGSVYLPFGAEYSILIKNKDARRASVTVEVDGQDVLNGHSLIVDGNESQEIKGFMRNMSKTNRFKFIQKTKEIQEHRGDRIDDGLVRVTYQFEEPIKFPTLRKISERTFWDDSSANWYYNNPSTTGGTFNSVNYCSSDLCKSKSFAPRVDEGITVKGEDIIQNYQHGNIGFLDPEINTIVLHLKGQTKRKKIAKPITVKTKLRCETCGRRNKSTNKFCFNCGTYLD